MRWANSSVPCASATANLQRLEAAKAQFQAVEEVFNRDDNTIFQVLEAQRRVIEAKLEYYQSQVDNMLALRSVHFEKGTLFSYHNIIMTESGWVDEAQRQAIERDQLKGREINYYFPGLQVGQQTNNSDPQLFAAEAQTIEFARNENRLNEASRNSETNDLSPLNALIEQSKNGGFNNGQTIAAMTAPYPTGSTPQVNPQAFQQVPIIQVNPTNLPVNQIANRDFAQPSPASMVFGQSDGVEYPNAQAAVGTGTNHPSRLSSGSLPVIHQPTRIASNQNQQPLAMTPKIPTQISSSPADTTAATPWPPQKTDTKVAELATAIGRVTEKAQNLGANMVNFAASNENPVPGLETDSARISDAASAAGNPSVPGNSTRR